APVPVPVAAAPAPAVPAEAPAPPAPAVEPMPSAAVAELPARGGLDYARIDFSRWTPFQRLANALVTAAVRCVADVRVEGAERVPASGPVLIAANHISMWDAPVLLSTAGRRTVIFAAEELRRFPWLHWTLHKIWDAIYLRRGEGDTEAVENALGVLRAGGVLGLSPEGIRSPEGLRRGLTGVAHLAARSGAPVLPVVLYGQEKIPARLRRLRRTQVTVRIGQPLRPPGREATAQALRAATEEVMVELARLLPPEYRGVYAQAAAADADERASA
ncbi:MAG TPA: lysophospholipid acyltransferase family protein, partial [Vicinamibacteria bacterium]|nr:lysophospholipid acyltransferase family protein [Vicinamibacteria bacterium]